MFKPRKTRLEAVDNMQLSDSRQWKLYVNHEATSLTIGIKGLYSLAYALQSYFFTVACRRKRHEKPEKVAGFTIHPVIHQGWFQYNLFFNDQIVTHCNEKTLFDIWREAVKSLYEVAQEIPQ